MYWCRAPCTPPDWEPPRARRLSTRAVGGQVEVGAGRDARVEPAAELHVDDKADERLAHLRHRQRGAFAGGREPDPPPRAAGLRLDGQRFAAEPVPRSRQGL